MTGPLILRSTRGVPSSCSSSEFPLKVRANVKRVSKDFLRDEQGVVHALPPLNNRLARAILNIHSRIRRNRDPRDVRLEVKARRLDERRQLILDLRKPLLGPLHRRIVHLINDNNDLGDTGGLDEHDVLPRLPTTLEPSFELALARGDDEDGDVGLCGAGDHGGHVGLVAWRVEDRVPPLGRLEVRSADFNCFPLQMRICFWFSSVLESEAYQHDENGYMRT